ncbi:MAG TPA: hypothetical protein VK980_00305 [Sphingomonas sp.]|nr:hypothetical protein [Sphingomonas sp.]
MTRYTLLATVAVAASLPLSAAAQHMDPGMHMPMPAPKPTSKPAAKPAPAIKHPPAHRPPPRHPAPPARAAAPAQMRPMDDMPGMTPATPTPPPAPQQTAPAPMEGMTMPMPPAAGGSTPPSPAMPAGHAGMAPNMAGMTMTGGGGAYATGSGTARLPANEGAMQGLHFDAGAWMMMVHGYAWGVYTDQGGPRGANEAYVQSMAMLSAARELGSGARLELRSMFSLEPLMGSRGYPNLFATGESADGVTPLIDRQHPHDLFMELSGRVDIDIAPDSSLFVYGGPVAEPALGPSAFMHRASAQYLPDSPITHHWFDSTHISFGVVTTGIATPHWQIEGSAFRGREPDQHRWDIETPKLDSWSVRATWTPSPAWAVQVSHGYIHSGEQLEPGVNEARTTASVQYATGGLSTTFGFSIKDKQPGRTLTAWLAEANWDLDRHHTLFARAENVANDELFPNPADPLHDRKFRVSKLEGGYAYRLKVAGPVQAALGGSLGVYAIPAALDAAYGKFPVSFSLFAKLSLGH